MSGSGALLFSTHLAQAVGAILLSIVLLGFYRYYRRSYLLHWTWSWWALAVFLISGALSFYFARIWPAAHPFRILVAGVSQIAAYWQAAWLLFGAYEVAYNREVPRSLSRRILLLTTVLGILSVVLFLHNTGASASRHFVRVGVRALITGAAFSIAAYSVWGRADKETLGPRIVAGAFLIYGFEQIHNFAVVILEQWIRTYIPYLTYLGFLDVVLQFVMGLGMVIWFLEVERERVVRASAQIEHMAYHDPLTRLPNRQLFLDRVQLALAQSQRSKKSICILFLDLDRFKNINDSLGHTVGDELLRAVAERIRRSLRAGDTVARLGGDEFTVLLPDANREESGFVSQKLLDTLRQPFSLHDHELFISTSIGVSAFPDDGADAETLLKNADTAMYRAKEQGKDSVQFFAPAMNSRALEKLSLENGLRKALPANEFVLHYQPVLDFETERIRSVEALLRWRHPEQGLLFPADFLYVAEVCGIMDDLNRWALECACFQVQKWQADTPDLSVAVNISARLFQNPSLVLDVERTLRKTGLSPELLTLEITETTAMQNAEASLGVLKDLKQLGVRIAIDDFGTGYSSLSYLRTFPIDILKVDRAFVRDIHSDPEEFGIAAAVITLAHGLKMRVVAEGVETLDQFHALRNKGCDEYQGYLFSKPLPARDIEQRMAGEWSYRKPGKSARQH